MTPYEKLKTIFNRLSHLLYLQRILGWDEAVMMPAGAGEYRGEAAATFNEIIQQTLTNKKVGTLIATAQKEKLSSRWDRKNLYWMQQKYMQANCIPVKLEAKYIAAQFSTSQAWRKLRAENNWADFMPYLSNLFNLTKEIAERKSQQLQCLPYDALINDFTPGLTQKKMNKIIVSLQALPALRQTIIDKQACNPAPKQSLALPIAIQKELALATMQAMQFDFNHGRLDISHHPFCEGITIDTRATTRYNETHFLGSLFGVIHETGHGLYEQGMPTAWLSQPVGQTQDIGFHESQSLLFENDVCLSPHFFKWVVTQIAKISNNKIVLSAENVYLAATRVTPNLIRVDTDEPSYPLHVILRYEIERALFANDITIQDLPTVWNEKMLHYFNISTEGNDKDGVMQDSHWPSGSFGYFPAYLVGRLMAAQLYHTFISTHQTFEKNLQQALFQPLHQWLQAHVYLHGSLYSYEALLKKATGETLNPDYFMAHIKQRYL